MKVLLIADVLEIKFKFKLPMFVVVEFNNKFILSISSFILLKPLITSIWFDFPLIEFCKLDTELIILKLRLVVLDIKLLFKLLKPLIRLLFKLVNPLIILLLIEVIPLIKSVSSVFKFNILCVDVF